MLIHQFDCFKARTNYHRTDDLVEGTPPDNTEVLLKALWIAEDDPFSGQWIFQTSKYIPWIPACDLELIEPINSDQFNNEHLNFLKT